jgi:hypothetical protein
MKDFRILLSASVVSFSALFATGANAAPTSGTVVLNNSGTFKTAVTAAGAATCSGIVFLAPDTTAKETISSLLAALVLNSSQQNASAAAVIGGNRATFTCTVSVPYLWENVTTTQQLGIAYTVKASDPGFFNPNTKMQTPGTNPGKTRQVLKFIPVPSNGTTTTVSVNVSL